MKDFKDKVAPLLLGDCVSLVRRGWLAPASSVSPTPGRFHPLQVALISGPATFRLHWFLFFSFAQGSWEELSLFLSCVL